MGREGDVGDLVFGLMLKPHQSSILAIADGRAHVDKDVGAKAEEEIVGGGGVPGPGDGGSSQAEERIVWVFQGNRTCWKDWASGVHSLGSSLL